MAIWHFLKRLKELWDWLGLAWQLAGFLGFTGIAISIGGTVWAMILGLPAPFILMAGFCTFVAAIWIGLAPLAYQAFSGPTPTPIQKSAEKKPNYSAWRNRQHIPLGDAGCLFADLVPTVQNRVRPDVLEYFNALLDAAKSGDIKFVFRNPEAAKSSSKYEIELQYLDSHTLITLHELKKFAEKRGYNPPFLRDT